MCEETHGTRKIIKKTYSRLERDFSEEMEQDAVHYQYTLARNQLFKSWEPVVQVLAMLLNFPPAMVL